VSNTNEEGTPPSDNWISIAEMATYLRSTEASIRFIIATYPRCPQQEDENGDILLPRKEFEDWMVAEAFSPKQKRV
jgi:hypothetical protein